MLAQWLRDAKKFFQDNREEESYLECVSKNIVIKNGLVKFKLPKYIRSDGVDFEIPCIYAKSLSVHLKKIGLVFRKIAICGGVITFSICNSREELKLRELAR